MSGGDRGRAGVGALTSLVAWTVLLCGLWLWARDVTGGPGLPPLAFGAAAGRAEAGAGHAERDELPPPRAPLPGDAVPESVTVDAAGVAAEVVPRGLDEDGGVEAPPYEAPELVGWYADGAAPGAEGAAVLVGHRDTESAPAVFHELADVEPGDRVRVTRADGQVALFTVDDVRTVPRADFDPDRVYGQRTPGAAELRLLTCGGAFDPGGGGYAANVVVSAYLTGVAV
ncbi:LPXTG-site transpeptidase (sortase) family protein [Streptomyces zhaozhouensis]|uniref:LPXTG-site transpeptidase (Sortase) family protein n=1 Tax=Streptomyces zhaozhouensis TaxID=1300267 RepID=A0A286E2E8_9ACTN|nr:class F sortase [Streptomyces zhaozhouensis]SOD65064.1 LPXTG-site transpeptidase (sortase) family protein [Streptomyces zhaozhouensis]